MLKDSLPSKTFDFIVIKKRIFDFRSKEHKFDINTHIYNKIQFFYVFKYVQKYNIKEKSL